MKLIDKLINKAEMSYSERPEIAFITFDKKNGLYKADCRFRNGAKGKGTHSVVSEHKTQREAIEAVERAVNQYTKCKDDFVVFIDDLEDDENSSHIHGYYASHNLDGTLKSG